MTLALYMLMALVGVGIVLRLLHRPSTSDEPGRLEEETGGVEGSGECCGMHVTCERDSLLAAVSNKIEYYDDEELDAYRGVAAENYGEESTEQFRDVLLTLMPDDIAGWARSLQLRGIELPAGVREELLMIVGEERRRRNIEGNKEQKND